MSYPRQADLEALLDALAKAGVEFIVVGGAAAVLHGAPTPTVDLDIVHRQSSDNVHRLMEVLTALGAKYRDPAGRVLRPTEEALLGDGQLLLSTALGPCDLLCRLHDGRRYADLLAHTDLVTDDRLSLRVVDLDTLIDIKKSTGRAKDRLLVPVLLALKSSRRP